MIDTLPKDKKIVLFDGVCNLCNGFVDKIISQDKKDVFRFASLQSEIGIAIQEHLQLDTSQLDSVILYVPEKGTYYHKSSAAFRILNEFGGAWKLLQVFRILPKFINDFGYNIVAKYRYKWFGQKNTCRMPTPEERARFLG
ncbi:thiol-disulfide oxidoreductase DCC family protein [Kordia sp.]|uniref:thiol-disulfide oxidoreductase DCC family protein n=1 Tax=Kordia sp. TaxID=1965332 RepID=UPI0025C6841E|nr:thiol-disulfide oxidoreductase DCC family protein [Kordia sp.]MCH2195092.1 thiol-disulfide oxidoreductase DCC family protein [Kordia sp.]